MLRPLQKTTLLFFLFFTSLSCLADRGETLYDDNCAICHGHKGTGGVGIPLGLTSFLQQAPDEYLRRTIRIGRPGRIMPSFYRLSDKDIDAIITYIRSWKKTTIPAWDTTRITGDASAGKQLFNKHCISCHGENGQGGKGTGMMFSRPRDLPIA
ncbi:MAG: cytochrome c, partial [Gammaproteobacteria bacterium]|nr:cytochrome c [Gammaproteobacteria bacterium]